MDVAILYSGGKDSTLAIEYAINMGWNIKYLLSVKPTRTDCYLFHFSTVEHTKKLATILGIKHVFVSCSVAHPIKEAEIVKDVILKNKVDAVVLGGIGLQETQIRTLQKVLMPYNIDVFASHAGHDHYELISSMIERGYEIIVTQIAAEGLTEEWLGRRLDSKSFNELVNLSKKFGFHLGAEGGHWESLVIDGPIFNKKLELEIKERVMESGFSGYLVAESVIKEKIAMEL